jgi:uncharacterized protein (TIGR02284 family)
MHAPHLDTLNGLLRGELAATETYQQALDQIDSAHGAEQLALIRDEHRDAVSLLRKHIREFGGDPETSSGTWGAIVKAVEGTAKLFGNSAALAALKQGEETGLSTYERLAEDDRLPHACKVMIARILVPRTRAHIETLTRLQEIQQA